MNALLILIIVILMPIAQTMLEVLHVLAIMDTWNWNKWELSRYKHH